MPNVGVDFTPSHLLSSLHVHTTFRCLDGQETKAWEVGKEGGVSVSKTGCEVEEKRMGSGQAEAGAQAPRGGELPLVPLLTLLPFMPLNTLRRSHADSDEGRVSKQ